MKKFLLITICLISVSVSLSQDNQDSLQNLTQKFRDFEYTRVIDDALRLLESKDKISNPELIEIYRMKGISHYALLDDSEARLSFIEILKIDTAYSLDPSFTSPKIISFFNEVKKEYLISIEGKEDLITVIKYDTIYVPTRDLTIEYNFKQALVRSLIIPGTGHLYLKSNLKSWLLTSLTAASIGTAIYFIIDTNEKEKIYLQEANRNETSEKYNDYNFSYRMRNLAFIGFAALWVYSQLDLLFFIEDSQPGIYSYFPKILINPNGALLSYHLEF